jgi:nucleoside 2-deoxyribosyltransferase
VKVYVASPIGSTVPTRAWYVDTLLPLLHGAGHDVLDPWAASAGHIADAAGDPDAIAAANRSAGARNEELIRSCDVVLAVLDGVDVDSGVAAEVGFAYALGTPVIGWRSDFRLAGDNAASVVNLQVEHFLSGPVETDLRTALARLR